MVQRKCFLCNGPHYAKDYPKRSVYGKCFLCDANHYARDCPKSKIVVGMQQGWEEMVGDEAPEKVRQGGTLQDEDNGLLIVQIYVDNIIFGYTNKSFV